LVPTSLDEYIAEHQEGDLVTGRITEVSGTHVGVELGEGIQGTCRIAAEGPAKQAGKAESKADLSSLSSMLTARWKGGAASGPAEAEAVRAGQIRSFRIAKLDRAGKKIELELA
jgi:small subunit ribosomal protein S1